jgi:hypothetical protein
MRVIEKAVAIIILALIGWTVIMYAATRFDSFQSNRILRVELGSAAGQLSQAVTALDSSGITNNIQMVIRNTQMDYFFIVLYWLTFVGLAAVAAWMGERALAIGVFLLITGAAMSDVLENQAIFVAMRIRPFADTVAVDIADFSQWKWTFFFLASVVLGLAYAVNRHASTIRRATGGLFIAGGAFGMLGIARYRVALDFSLTMIDFAMLLVAVALLLTLWKLYHSIRTLEHREHSRHKHAHA